MAHTRPGLDPVTEEIHGWTVRPEPRCHCPRQHALWGAWMLPAFALTALFFVVGIILLDPSVVHR